MNKLALMSGSRSSIQNILWTTMSKACALCRAPAPGFVISKKSIISSYKNLLSNDEQMLFTAFANVLLLAPNLNCLNLIFV